MLPLFCRSKTDCLLASESFGPKRFPTFNLLNRLLIKTRPKNRVPLIVWSRIVHDQYSPKQRMFWLCRCWREKMPREVLGLWFSNCPTFGAGRKNDFWTSTGRLGASSPVNIMSIFGQISTHICRYYKLPSPVSIDTISAGIFIILRSVNFC